MGWTGFWQGVVWKRGKIDRKATMDAEIEFYGSRRVVKSSMVGTTYYAAVETLKKYVKAEEGEGDENGYKYVDIPESERKVWGLVCLTSTNKEEFLYKDMSEDMNPYCYDCPISILNLLDETDSEWALEWRQKCRENAKSKKEKNWLQKLPIGGEVVWTRWDGKKFRLMKHAPAYQFKTWFWFDIDGGSYVKKKMVTIDNAVMA